YNKMGKKIIIHWPHRNRSTNIGRLDAETPEEGRLSRMICKGMIKCTNSDCKLVERPLVKDQKRILDQLDEACLCGAQREMVICPVIAEVRMWKGGIRLTNSDWHTHEPPPHILHLLNDEKEQFRAVVKAHPKATPLQLVIGPPGLTGPGESVAKITPVLRNTSRVSYERRNFIHEEIGTGGDNFFQAYAKCKIANPEFIRREVLGEVTVICCQTSFMRAQLVHNAIIEEPINGIVTDGAHKFFRSGLLIISSTYAIEMSRWIPGLFSYSNGATAAHYKIHFLTLFEGIAVEAESRQIGVTDGLFAGVMDFSDAQRNGFNQAFIEFWQSRVENTRSLVELANDAPTLLRGCTYHFQKTVTRVSRISHIVAPDRSQEFKLRSHALLEANTDDQFRKLAIALIHEFPGVEKWLEWWLRPPHAAMLFKSQRAMDGDIWDSIPSTTNAEESIHNTLHIGHGNDHEFFSGI
ncbi:hypothetical protein F5887DRAFT_874070, partial [Amanita rubescens]